MDEPNRTSRDRLHSDLDAGVVSRADKLRKHACDIMVVEYLFSENCRIGFADYSRAEAAIAWVRQSASRWAGKQGHDLVDTLYDRIHDFDRFMEDRSVLADVLDDAEVLLILLHA